MSKCVRVSRTKYLRIEKLRMKLHYGAGSVAQEKKARAELKKLLKGGNPCVRKMGR